METQMICAAELTNSSSWPDYNELSGPHVEANLLQIPGILSQVDDYNQWRNIKASSRL